MGNQNSQGIREPKQNRSIEKKNKIIDAGLELFKEKGFHNTNTAEIAAKAGVSTGTVYSYFKDKKAILVEVLDFYMKKIMTPMYDYISQITLPFDLKSVLRNIIEISLQMHINDMKLHEEISAMVATDSDINRFYHDFEESCVIQIAKVATTLGVSSKNINEKVHIIFNLFESFCHESAFHKHSFIDYDVMKEITIKLIVGLFDNEN